MNGNIVNTLIIDTLHRALSNWADKVALVDGDQQFTYKEFAVRVANLAQFLSTQNITKEDVVAFMGPNCHQFMECYYACAAIGSIFNPINFRLAAREIVNILEDSGAEIVFVHTDFVELLSEGIIQVPSLRLVILFGGSTRTTLGCPFVDYELALASGTGQLPDNCPLAAADPAHLYYTSGTTGRAKGVVLTHGNVVAHAVSAIAELKLSCNDTWLHVAPMFHLADAWATFAITAVGGKHVFVPYFESCEVLKCMEREKVTITNMVPTMLNALLNDPNIARYNYGSLRLLLSGGAPIAPQTVRRIIAGFGCDYVQTYGMTETSPYLTLSILKEHMLNWPEEKKLQVKCRTGRPFASVELKVVRADGSDVNADDAEVGEIIVRGPTVMPGYWQQPLATQKAIIDGWLYTGDLAVIDAEGYVNIVDRKKDIVLTGGETVYSMEVEHVLYEHPAVAECAVVGVPDETWGEAVIAFVVVRKGFSLLDKQLIEFVKDRLAHYKSPKVIYFLEELPKTGTGKIYKKGLRDSITTKAKSHELKL